MPVFIHDGPVRAIFVVAVVRNLIVGLDVLLRRHVDCCFLVVVCLDKIGEEFSDMEIEMSVLLYLDIPEAMASLMWGTGRWSCTLSPGCPKSLDELWGTPAW